MNQNRNKRDVQSRFKKYSCRMSKNSKDTPCLGCETGTDAEEPHIDPKTKAFYTTCSLNNNYCVWCGRPSGKEDYCGFACMQAEKRSDDAASAIADYYNY